MPNKKYAMEWLDKAKHSLEAAKILYEARHYTDVIGFELQQAVEKVLKSIPAFHNRKIKRTHDLSILIRDVGGYIEVKTEYIKLCEIATDYYVIERYPSMMKDLPSTSEIKRVLDMAFDLYGQVKGYIEGSDKLKDSK